MRTTSNTNTSYGGIGFSGLLAICFIVLKLCGIIQWSWWWVLAPIWIPFLIVVMALVGVIIYGVFKDSPRKRS